MQYSKDIPSGRLKKNHAANNDDKEKDIREILHHRAKHIDKTHNYCDNNDNDVLHG